MLPFVLVSNIPRTPLLAVIEAATGELCYPTDQCYTAPVKGKCGLPYQWESQNGRSCRNVGVGGEISTRFPMEDLHSAELCWPSSKDLFASDRESATPNETNGPTNPCSPSIAAHVLMGDQYQSLRDQPCLRLPRIMCMTQSWTREQVRSCS